MAGFFGLYNYNKEGPGVAKNGPRKRPFVVFFEIYARKFWQLMQAGLLFFLVSLPLVTRGWADAGLTFVTRSFSREKHAFVREDFFETIRKNRGQAFACGLINLLVTGLLVFNIVYYLPGLMPGLYVLLGLDVSAAKSFAPGLLDYIVMIATVVGYVLFTWMKYYIPFLVITFRLRTKQVYKNAFIFAVSGLKPNLLISVALLAIYGIALGIILLIPSPLAMGITLLLWVLLVPAFRSFLIQFCIFPAIRRLMIDPYYAQNPHADKQARLDLNLDVEDAPGAAEQAVFTDAAPQPEPTEATRIPRQYSEREMAKFHRHVDGRADDDDTI